MEYLRSDYILSEILEDRKTLTGFLDAIFGFMSRNTDFYRIQNTKDDQLGFPKGVKEQILMSCMQKYEHILEQPKLVQDLVTEDPSFVSEEIEIVAEQYNKSQQQPVSKNVGEILETSEDSSYSTNTTKFNESDYKNGSLFENYCWSQTLKDVELCVLLPKDVKIAKHIKMDLKSNHIKIKTLLTKEEILINAVTWDKYRHNDVIWSISEGKLILSFDKLKECWWDKLFSNETSINIKNLDTECSINSYSPDVQNAVEKLQAQERDHEFKTLKPSESEQISRLRQAWDADGSPFHGLPFDPSVIQFN